MTRPRRDQRKRLADNAATSEEETTRQKNRKKSSNGQDLNSNSAGKLKTGETHKSRRKSSRLKLAASENVNENEDSQKTYRSKTGSKQQHQQDSSDIEPLENQQLHKVHASPDLRLKSNKENICDFSVNFSHRKSMLNIGVVRQYGERGTALSVPQYLHGAQCRMLPPPVGKKVINQPVVDIVSSLCLYRTASPFQRRCQAVEWHPTKPNTVAVASKCGEVIMWNIDQLNQEMLLPGGGVGDQINSMRFVPFDHTKLMTTSANGMVQFRDLEGRHDAVLLDTENFQEHWYCGADISAKQNVIVAGDNFGNTQIVSPRGEKGWKHRLHKSKVTHVEFSPREPTMFCTASVDRTVKLWDLRMIKDRSSSLFVLQHDRPINSAHFSLTDGCRLLTTDQYDEIRLYTAPCWHLERTIKHPHRQFQHLTSIKATWHPLVDLIVAGRYPDKDSAPSERRTIDIFDADTGELVHQLIDSSAPGIISLNKFSPQGDCLVSGMGYNILVWSKRHLVAEKQQKLMAGMKDRGLDPDRGNNRRRRNNGGGGAKKKMGGATEVKVKTKTSTKTKTRDK